MVAMAMLWPSIESMQFRYKVMQWQLLYRQLQKNGGQTLVHKHNSNMCVLEFNNFFLYITEVLDLGVIEYTLSSARSTGIPPCQYALTREAATRSRHWMFDSVHPSALPCTFSHIAAPHGTNHWNGCGTAGRDGWR
jgi:hypothetical protein